MIHIIYLCSSVSAEWPFFDIFFEWPFFKVFWLYFLSDSSLILTVKEFSYSKTTHLRFETEEIIKGLHKTINISAWLSDDLSENKYRTNKQKVHQTSGHYCFIFVIIGKDKGYI